MKKLLIPVFLLVPFTGAHAATFILSSDTFGTGQNILNAGNANVALTTTAGDPTSSGHGNVGSADIAPGGRWGEVRAQVNSLAIPVESTPGTDTFSMSLDVYIPSATTFAATDRVGVILRWGDAGLGRGQGGGRGRGTYPICYSLGYRNCREIPTRSNTQTVPGETNP